ncbi:MAG TPA: hypothetical protein VFS00_15620 [Polyangiaceae bacterium]|nr:hypothetical protein [Polyangiaceae bacterium]
MADQVTFRDFAGAVMQGDDAGAGRVLSTLLGLEPPAAAAATAYFRQQMAADPSFMMKAMGMRTAVEARDQAQLESLLRDCFGLGPSEAASAASLLANR